MVALRPYTDEHLDAVLRLIGRSDSTGRTAETWNGNGMTAVTAFDGGRLIGVLPLERRTFSLGGGRFMEVLWISAAHVEPEYRNRGIGTAMDRKVEEYFFPERKAVFVYRGDETSLAYKWYSKLGYRETSQIISYKKDVTVAGESSGHLIFSSEEEVRLRQHSLYACFMRNAGLCGGFPKRTPWFWTEKLRNHYYRDYYSYSVAAIPSPDGIEAYAFLGETAIRDNVRRIDVLEFICPDDPAARRALYNAVMDVARRRGLKEVRIQVASQEPLHKWVKSMGFTSRMRFNMMSRLSHPVRYLKECLAEKVDLEHDCRFILQSPDVGEHVVGGGKRHIKLFARSGLLSDILLCRCSVENAVDEGRLVAMDGDDALISVLSDVFPMNSWRYFHIDYV